MSSGDESQVSMHSVEIVAPRSAAQQEQRAQEGQYTDTDDDEEEAWDEVEIAEQQRDAPAPASTSTSTSTPRESFEITLDKSADGTGKGNGKGNRAKGKGKGISIQERRARQQLHRAHAACLLASGAIRNSWLNDPLLQARLLSLVPLKLQNAFHTFSPKSHPDPNERSRLFDAALKGLTSFWWRQFDVDDGPGVRREPVADIDALLQASIHDDDDDMAAYQARVSDELRDAKSLMRRAVLMRGSRDVSPLLFCATLRALAVPTRLVFSLQPADWRSPSVVANDKRRRGQHMTSPRRKGSDVPSSSSDDDDDDDDDDERNEKKKQRAKAKAKAAYRERAGYISISDGDSVDGGGGGALTSGTTTTTTTTMTSAARLPVRLRKTKSRASLNSKARRGARSPTPDTAASSALAPVFWVEVYARARREWIALDPVRNIVRAKSKMEPPRQNGSGASNVLLYAVAYEDDGSLRDVTRRYARHFVTHTLKLRAPSRKDHDWFGDMLRPFARRFRLNRDVEEDDELLGSARHETMPNSIAGFKDHPNYAMARHLKRDETIEPGAKVLGRFRGDDEIYARSAVVQLKSAENWLRVGRVVRDGEEPLKTVKARAVTLERRRKAEALALEGEQATQGLYAERQTKLYVAPPVVDGRVPRNSFGNVDLYTPSMLPKGGAHVRCHDRLAARCAKQLGLDFADAVTGFEFRQRRAVPTLDGVVVAQDVADTLREAVAQAREMQDDKALRDRQDQASKLWRKLIDGVHIRQRLHATYGAS